MTDKDYHSGKTTDQKLEDIHKIATSIEEKVEEILDGIRDLEDLRGERNYQQYSGYDRDLNGY